MQGAGIPDILGCCHGRFFAIELKAPGEEPSKVQLATMKEMREKGRANTCVASSLEGVIDFIEILRGLIVEIAQGKILSSPSKVSS